jgi:hypothetical protein
LPLLVSVVDVGALAAFALLHASVVGYFVAARRAERRIAHGLVPVAGALVALWVLVEANRAAQLTGLVWVAAGAAVYLTRRGRWTTAA